MVMVLAPLNKVILNLIGQIDSEDGRRNSEQPKGGAVYKRHTVS